MTQPKRFQRKNPYLLLCAVLLLAPVQLWARDAGHIEHTLLTLDENLTISQVVDAALMHSPQQPLAQTYTQQARDQQYISERWVIGVPRLNLNYKDDQLMGDSGLKEAGIGLEFDLWRRKQRATAKALANHQQQLRDSWQPYLRWQIAGQVRAMLAQLATIDARVKHSEQNLKDVEALLEISRKRFRAGDLPESAVLQSEALVLEAKQQLQVAHAEQVDSYRNYSMLTGMDQRPADIGEAPSGLDRISESHPQLRYLTSERQQKLTELEQSRRRAGGNTTLSVDLFRERGASGEPMVDSLGLSVSMPLGGNRYGRASNSTEALAATQADVELQQAHRQLQQQFHEVQHELHLQQETLAMANQSARLTERQWQMAKKAFQLGESDLQPVILAQQHYQQSQLFLQLQQLRQRALQASYKQVVGELP